MNRRQALWGTFAALTLASCSVPLHAVVTGTGGWQQPALLVGLLVAMCIARMMWLLASAARSVSVLPRAAGFDAVVAAGERAGIRGLSMVDSDQVFAFCSGVIHPRVLVSSSLATSVSGPALDAVLVHEAHHARRREPLRRAALAAVADILLPFPALRWWAERQIEDSELDADRAAIQCVGVEAVAAALVAVGVSTPRTALAAFGGVADLRAAQLLGEPMPARPLPLRTLVGTLVGLGVLASAGLCLS